MASLFVIREKNTNTFCTSSSKSRVFVTDLQAAAMFASKKNAEKAIKGMFTKEVNPYGGNTWAIYAEDGTLTYYHHNFLQEYIDLLESKGHDMSDLRASGVERFCDMEAVEVKLTLV